MGEPRPQYAHTISDGYAPMYSSCPGLATGPHYAGAFMSGHYCPPMLRIYFAARMTRSAASIAGAVFASPMSVDPALCAALSAVAMRDAST